jgi:hypothetical protein
MAPSRIPASAGPGSRLLGFGGTVGAATLGAAIATAPAMLRIEDGSARCGPLGTWAILVAITLVPMGVAVLVLRRARGGFAALGSRESLAPVLTVLFWLASTFVSLVILGAALRARTHHRALGGVVFALGALAVNVALGLFSLRLAKLVRRLPRWVLWTLGVAFFAGLGFLVAFARAQMAESGPPLPTAESAKLVDGVAFVVSALLASGSPLVPRRSLALIGPPLAVVMLVLGVSSARTCPRLRETLGEDAPLCAWFVELTAPH